MGIADAAKPVLETSVSFGRFEKDSLSWEKWSSFSPNKYLEEVGKCATPGSVASKKAYFEAHYKKVAAKKAAESQAGPEEGDNSPRIEEDHVIDLTTIPAGSETETSFRDVLIVSDDVHEKVEDKLMDETVETKHPEEEEEVKEVDESMLNESIICKIDQPPVPNKAEIPSLPFDEEDTNMKIELVPVESVLLEEAEANILEKQISAEERRKPKKDIQTNSRQKKSLMQSEVKKDVPKAIRKKENPGKQISTKAPPKTVPTSKPSKNQTAPVNGTKIPQVSSSKASISAPSSSAKNSGLKSLHLSISVEAKTSDKTNLTTARSSLIMERMKDKDIIKRAFKTFQHGVHKPIETQQTSSIVEKTRSKEKITPKKEKTILPVSKGRREPEIKLLRQSLDFKATPLPRFYKANKGTKKPLAKVERA